MKPTQIKRKLYRLGWEALRKKGSHLIFKKKNETISLPEHQGKDIDQNLVRTIAKKNHMTLVEFKSF